MRKNWQRDRSTAKKEALKKTFELIKASNIVINLSHDEIPDLAYIYLAIGLELVESATVDKENLRFDLHEFIRKLSWKICFKTEGISESSNNDLHKALRVKSNKYPDYSTSLFE